MADSTTHLPLRPRATEDERDADVISLASTDLSSPVVEKKEDDVISLASDASDRTTVNDLIDVDIDPSTTLASIETLLDILRTSLQILTALQDSTEDEVITGVFAKCANLVTSVEELHEVVKGYAETYNPREHQGSRLTLDPAVYKWTTDCVLSALGLQADVSRLLHQVEDVGGDDSQTVDSFVLAEAEEAEVVVTLHRYGEPLEHWNQTLEAFLPILRCDLNEYMTSKLNFPAATPWDAPNYHLGERSLPGDPSFVPSNSYTSLRRELYDLKDIVKDSTLEILRFGAKTSGVPQSLLDITAKAGQNVTDTLSEILSNNGSDWLDSMLSGRMTFAEFQALSRVQLGTSKRRLKELAIRVRDDRLPKDAKSTIELFVDRLVELGQLLKVAEAKEPARPWKDGNEGEKSRESNEAAVSNTGAHYVGDW